MDDGKAKDSDVTREELAASARAGAPSGLLRNVITVLSPVLVTAVALLPALDGDFVWDDRMLILENPSVRSLRPLGHFFTQLFWQPSPEEIDPVNFYRPFVLISYAVDRALFGVNATGFHFTNLLLHLVNVGLLCALALRLGAPVAAAALAAGAWGVAPRLAESVVWISGRTDVLALSFVLVGFHLYRSGNSGLPFRIGALAAVALGMYAKEVAVAALTGMLVASAARPRGETETAPARFREWIVGFLLMAPYVVLRAVVTIGAPKSPPSNRWVAEPFMSVLYVLEAAGRYVFMALDPWQPRTQIGLFGFPSASFVALGVVSFGAAIVFGARAARRLRSFDSFAVALSVTALVSTAMVLHVVPIRIDVVAADRFLYVPLACLALLGARAAARVPSRASRWAIAGAVAIVLLLGVRTWRRSFDFASEANLWVEAVENSHPMNPRPVMRLGGLYFAAGLYEDALPLYVDAESIRLRSPYYQKLKFVTVESIARVRTLVQLGRYDEAIARFRAARDAVPGGALSAIARTELGRLELSLLQFPAAERDLRAVLSRYPDYPMAHALLSATLGARRAIVARDRTMPGAFSDPRSDAHWLVADPRPDADPLELGRRAELSSAIGRRLDAIRLYRSLLSRADAPTPLVFQGALFLARYGDPSDAARTLDAVKRELPAEAVSGLSAIVEMRRADQQKLIALFPRLPK